MPMLSNAAITAGFCGARNGGPAIVLRSRRIDQAARPPLRGHLANMVGVCHSLSVALAGSSP
jgi:hypothetical protein